MSMKFKTVSGESDRCSGMVFNVKPNGDWLAIRYNDTENNIVLWEFHNGIRRSVKRGPERTWMLDRAAWHELKATVDGASFKAWIDGNLALEYTLGSAPGPGRNNAAPNPDLFPENNAVLRPPVEGRVGLLVETDSTSYFERSRDQSGSGDRSDQQAVQQHDIALDFARLPHTGGDCRSTRDGWRVMRRHRSVVEAGDWAHRLA